MDQFKIEKPCHSSNVMGFDVDAALHYRTPIKPQKPLFICLLPMQKTLLGNMPHFSYAFKKNLLHTHTHTSAHRERATQTLPSSLFHIISIPRSKIYSFTLLWHCCAHLLASVKQKTSALQRCLIVNKVSSHLCKNVAIHPQLQTDPWWQTCS